MADFYPFRAIRYDFERLGGDLSTVLAPPYDVLDAEDKARLLAQSPDNIVGVDLPHTPPKTLGPPKAYEDAAKQLQSMRESGVLVRDERPTFYLYHQQFAFEGAQFTRKMLIGALRLYPFEDGVVLPHEQTFGGPKEDRLALMRATQANLSPIFALYRDPEQTVSGLTASIAQGAADAHATLDQVDNRLWLIQDTELAGQLTGALADKTLYIADGHHRYNTALNYRNALSNDGALAADHPANFVMTVLASMDDPGSLIAPYHRVVCDVGAERVRDAWGDACEPAGDDLADITLVDGQSQQSIALKFGDRSILRQLEADQVEPWYELDAAYLHRRLLDDLLSKELGHQPVLQYVKSADDARATATRTDGTALLVNATPMAHLRAMSDAGGLMPQKSTYFYPKLATGLTIKSLVDG